MKPNTEGILSARTARSGLLLAFLLLAGFSAAAGEPIFQYVRKEVEWGQSINLEDFGGSHIEVFVRNREMSFITTETADYTRMLPIARTYIRSVEVDSYSNTANIYGRTSVNTQPSKNKRNIQKKDGTVFPGSNSTMYLLHNDPGSGVKVYFLDAISSQNSDSIVIAVPKPAPLPRPSRIFSSPPLPPPSTPPTRSPASNKAKSGQPISPELFIRYVALQKERELLDPANPEAVAEFNLHAEAYHEALRIARTSNQK